MYIIFQIIFYIKLNLHLFVRCYLQTAKFRSYMNKTCIYIKRIKYDILYIYVLYIYCISRMFVTTADFKNIWFGCCHYLTQSYVQWTELQKNFHIIVLFLYMYAKEIYCVYHFKYKCWLFCGYIEVNIK